MLELGVIHNVEVADAAIASALAVGSQPPVPARPSYSKEDLLLAAVGQLAATGNGNVGLLAKIAHNIHAAPHDLGRRRLRCTVLGLWQGRQDFGARECDWSTCMYLFCRTMFLPTIPRLVTSQRVQATIGK
jgi:hypothetical protein